MKIQLTNIHGLTGQGQIVQFLFMLTLIMTDTVVPVIFGMVGLCLMATCVGILYGSCKNLFDR